MAMVPTIGAPQVSPNTSPTPMVSVQPPQQAFLGGALGQGANQLGAAAEHTSDALEQHAIQFQQINNQLDAAKAGQAATDAMDLYRQQYQQNNVRAAASANLGSAYTKLDELLAKGGEGLSMPAQVEYMNQMRRQLAVTKSELTSFAMTERRKDIAETTHAGNMQAIAQYQKDGDEGALVAAIGKNAALQSQAGLISSNPDVVKQEMLKYTSLAFGNRTQQLYDNGDLDGARSFYAAHADSMTPETSTHLASTLRTATHANYIDGMALSMVRGGDIPSRTAPVPNARWDTGLTSFRADPAAALAQFGLPGATVTSGARSPEHNAAVGGSPTSEHLTNSAWDFQPPAGMSLQQAANTLADHLHAAGIPYDQIEVDSANNHVHVGFGEKNRNQTIDQNGQVMAGGSAGHFAPMAVGPTTDPNEFLASALTRAQTFIDSHPDMLPQDKVALLSSVERQARVVTLQLDSTQKAAYDKLDDAVVSGGIQDITALTKQFPGEWNNLPAKYKASLERSVQWNARVPSPQRQANLEALDYQRITDPASFVNADIRSMDLPFGEQRRFLQQQAKMRQDITSGKQLDDSVGKALKMPEVQQAVRSLNITPTSDPQAYGSFMGALGAAFEVYRDDPKHGGQLPHGKDLSDIVARITATHAGGFLNGMQIPAFQVPDDSRAKIVADYQRTNGGVPSEQEIQRRWLLRSGVLNYGR